MRPVAAVFIASFVASMAGAQAKPAQDYVDALGRALQAASHLRVTVVAQKLTGAPYTTKIELSKPNLARIDNGPEHIVADGNMLSVYDESRQIYYTTPEKESDLLALFRGPILSLYEPFFDSKGLRGWSDFAFLGQKRRKNVLLDVVQGKSQADDSVLTLYLDPNSGMMRQAEVSSRYGPADDVLIIDGFSADISSEPAGGDFAFAPPGGAQAVSPDDYNAAVWRDFEEGRIVSQRTHKLQLVFFYDRSTLQSNVFERDVLAKPEFVSESRRYVFSKVDKPRNFLLAKQFDVRLAPTVVILTPSGDMLATVSPQSLESFIARLDSILKSAKH